MVLWPICKRILISHDTCRALDMLPNAQVILPIASGSHSQDTATPLCPGLKQRPAVWLRPHDGSVAGHILTEDWLDYFPWLNTRMCLIPCILAWVLPDQESLFPLPFWSSFPCVPAYPTLIMEHFLVILSFSSFSLVVVLNWDLCSILSTIMMELLMSGRVRKTVVRKPGGGGACL